MAKIYRNAAKNLMQLAIAKKKVVLIVDSDSDDDYELIVNEKGIRAGYAALSESESKYIHVIGEGVVEVDTNTLFDEAVVDYTSTSFFEAWWSEYEDSYWTAAQTLDEYIFEEFDGNSAAFARAMSVKPQQVTKWKKQGLIVVEDEFYRPVDLKFKAKKLSRNYLANCETEQMRQTTKYI